MKFEDFFDFNENSEKTEQDTTEQTTAAKDEQAATEQTTATEPDIATDAEVQTEKMENVTDNGVDSEEMDETEADESTEQEEDAAATTDEPADSTDKKESGEVKESTEQADLFSSLGIECGLRATVKFTYQNKEENLSNLDITFEELRKEKQEDFLELEEPDKVTWNVSYLVSRDIKNPKTKISDYKAELEKDKDFKKALKNNKKPLVMVIRPRVASKTKGGSK